VGLGAKLGRKGMGGVRLHGSTLKQKDRDGSKTGRRRFKPYLAATQKQTHTTQTRFQRRRRPGYFNGPAEIKNPRFRERTLEKSQNRALLIILIKQNTASL
jgi:hypothetical protein